MDEETQLVPSASTAPGVTEAEELAARIIRALDLVTARMGLETPHPATAKRVRSGRTVSREFVEAMIVAVEALPELQRLRTFDSAEARDVLQGRASMQAVADRVAMLVASVNYTIEARWAKVARAALDTFRLASAIADSTDNAVLAAHVEVLRRHLGRKNGRKAKKTKG
jgi:hypothetical protein